MAGLDDVYIVNSGKAVITGKPIPAVPLPTWVLNVPLNTLIEIPGTVHPMRAGPVRFPATDSFSGMAVTIDGEIFTLAPGGHSDGEDNDVWSLNLMADSPSWVLRCAPSAVLSPYEQPYYTDGKPAARHTYWTTMYVPQLNRILNVGCSAVPISGQGTFPTVDGFNPITNQWEEPGKYGYVTLSPYAGPDNEGVWPGASGPRLGVMVTAAGVIWTAGLSMKYDIATNVWSSGVLNGQPMPRGPWVDCPSKGYSFGMCFGDAQGYDTFLGANAYKLVGTTATKITFNPSAALTQFLTDAPLYTGMDYDPVNEEFIQYSGVGATAGRFYAVKPNDTSVWDVSIRTYAGTIVATPGSGLLNRIRYIPQLKGFIILPAKTNGVYFVHTS